MTEPAPNFEGHTPRECGEHRTVGPHRAWCHDCSEWCYPSIEVACKGCELAALRAVERLTEECNTTADTVLQLAGQREAVIAACRDLEAEAEYLRGQAARTSWSASWEKAQAIAEAIGRVRKALGEDSRE